MDAKTVAALWQVLGDHWKAQSAQTDPARRINAILHNKRVPTVFQELAAYCGTLAGQDKNKAAAIVTLALLRRDLEAMQAVQDAIQAAGLEGALYGGLLKLLSGKSGQFSIRVRLDNGRYANQYEFIAHFWSPSYWRMAELFQAARVLHTVAPSRFEQLALKDRTDWLLLHMASGQLPIQPSKDMLDGLARDGRELRQNIGFYFATREVSQYLRKMGQTDYGSGQPQKARRKENAAIKRALDTCRPYLEACDARGQAALLLNFLLVNRQSYPTGFARALLSGTLRAPLIDQIRHTDKLRTIEDAAWLAQLTKRTPALSETGKRISKSDLNEAIADKLLAFVDARSGIYGWEERQKQSMGMICQSLTAKSRKRLAAKLAARSAALMCSELDALVRYPIYLEDARQQEIIQGMLQALNTEKG